MNSITTTTQANIIIEKNHHKEWVLEKTLSFLQPIVMELMSRISSIDINRSNTSTSVHLSFCNDYSQK